MPDPGAEVGANRHVYRRLVHFAETDMAGILHFANTLRYMEEAEHSLFRALGLTVHEHDPAGVWGWARRRLECDYIAPLRYQDRVDVEVAIARIGRSAIDYGLTLQKVVAPGAPHVPIARGTVTTVCIGRGADGGLAARPIPEGVRHTLLAWSRRPEPSRDGIA